MDVVLCLYSRYCTESVKFLKELEEQMEVRKLCVDHEVVRGRLLESDYKVSKVPIVLIFHHSGEMEKIEGKDCYDWLTFIRNKLKETETPVAEEPVRLSVEKIDFEKEEEPEKSLGDEELQQPNKKEGGILNRAQQMQKERVADLPMPKHGSGGERTDNV